VTEAVLDDWRTAPVDERLRATLGFLEKLTLEPESLTRADAEAVRATGVSDPALLDAIAVAALFNVIDRIADALRFEVPPPEAFAARADRMLATGYALD
jgi:alkylhydroperoxidase family enzyme